MTHHKEMMPFNLLHHFKAKEGVLRSTPFQDKSYSGAITYLRIQLLSQIFNCFFVL